MTVATAPAIWNAVELAERFGPISLDRIVTPPAPGLATEEDAIEWNERRSRLCELVDGILVEEVMGAYESMLAAEIARLLGNFVKPRNWVIRIPDVAYLSMDKFPGGRFPKGAAAALAPDIAVEVLSPSNTKKEMAEKLEDYFASGGRLVLHVDPEKQQVEVFTSVEPGRIVTIDQMLDGGNVLPGFELNLKELFAELPPE